MLNNHENEYKQVMRKFYLDQTKKWAQLVLAGLFCFSFSAFGFMVFLNFLMSLGGAGIPFFSLLAQACAVVPLGTVIFPILVPILCVALSVLIYKYFIKPIYKLEIKRPKEPPIQTQHIDTGINNEQINSVLDLIDKKDKELKEQILSLDAINLNDEER